MAIDEQGRARDSRATKQWFTVKSGCLESPSKTFICSTCRVPVRNKMVCVNQSFNKQMRFIVSAIYYAALSPAFTSRIHYII